jgi:ubiquinone/menaquinone biosynthesis C-methylase UbiE
MSLTELYSAMTERQKAVWSAGDWPAVAPTIADASSVVVEKLGVGPGQDYLDVATGSGTAAILGAKRGARTTGLDFVPKLVDAATERAAAEGVEATFVVGDAQDLPFEDGSFDRVSSVFGAMFAPDQERAAAELVRVCRPGGVIAVAAWTPEGLNGRMFMTLGKHMPPPPEGFKPPVLWGTDEHVRKLFAGQDVQTERVLLTSENEDFEELVKDLESKLGPMVMARKVLEPEGKWEAAREDVLAIYKGANELQLPAIRTSAEYLLTTVRKA